LSHGAAAKLDQHVATNARPDSAAPRSSCKDHCRLAARWVIWPLGYQKAAACQQRSADARSRAIGCRLLPHHATCDRLARSKLPAPRLADGAARSRPHLAAAAAEAAVTVTGRVSSQRSEMRRHPRPRGRRRQWASERLPHRGLVAVNTPRYHNAHACRSVPPQL
jgi:hypothetical protein